MLNLHEGSLTRLFHDRSNTMACFILHLLKERAFISAVQAPRMCGSVLCITFIFLLSLFGCLLLLLFLFFCLVIFSLMNCGFVLLGDRESFSCHVGFSFLFNFFFIVFFFFLPINHCKAETLQLLVF